MRRVIPLFCAVFVMVSALSAKPLLSSTHHNIKTVNHAFAPGEKLTYSVSWSQLVTAGVAVMEVRDGRTNDGRRSYRLISSTKSVGLLDRFYPVRDRVESTIDGDELSSVSYHLQVSHGKRKRLRSLTFDRHTKTVRFIGNSGEPKIYPVPERVQDALSSLYYLRTFPDFVVGRPIVMDIHDGDKTWAVEIHVLGKERITTPAGEFDTIKVMTHPRYEGVFMNKGEIFIWLTDDARRIPVVMKSTISIGSIVATLTRLQSGQDKP